MQWTPPCGVRRRGEQTLGAGNRSWRNSCSSHLCSLHTAPPLSPSCSSRLRGGMYWASSWHLRAVHGGMYWASSWHLRAVAVALALVKSGHELPSAPPPMAEAGARGTGETRSMMYLGSHWQGCTYRAGRASRSSLLDHPWGNVRAPAMNFLSPGWPFGGLQWLWRMMRSLLRHKL